MMKLSVAHNTGGDRGKDLKIRAYTGSSYTEWRKFRQEFCDLLTLEKLHLINFPADIIVAGGQVKEQVKKLAMPEPPPPPSTAGLDQTQADLLKMKYQSELRAWEQDREDFLKRKNKEEDKEELRKEQERRGLVYLKQHLANVFEKQSIQDCETVAAAITLLDKCFNSNQPELIERWEQERLLIVAVQQSTCALPSGRR
jgi:hypothetical protein